MIHLSYFGGAVESILHEKMYNTWQHIYDITRYQPIHPDSKHLPTAWTFVKEPGKDADGANYAEEPAARGFGHVAFNCDDVCPG